MLWPIYNEFWINKTRIGGQGQARARGVKFGRKTALTPHQQVGALDRLAAGDTQGMVGALFNISQATVSRLVAGRIVPT